MREDEDALFRSANSAVNDFISFVWLMLAIEEDSGTDPAMVDLGAVVDSTLAAQSPQARAEARRRWPRTGTSIGSARDIDELARRLADAIISRYEDRTLGDIHAPVSAINRIPRTVARLLALREAPEWRFRVSSKGADIEVNPVGLLTGWLTGTSLPDLAQAYLAAAANRAWRIEQMVDAVTDHFEHYLAWTVGALVELVNSWLADAGIEERLCPDLGSYIRYGVNDPKALILQTSPPTSNLCGSSCACGSRGWGWPNGGPGTTPPPLKSWICSTSPGSVTVACSERSSKLETSR
jgi:hypothetical protein